MTSGDRVGDSLTPPLNALGPGAIALPPPRQHRFNVLNNKLVMHLRCKYVYSYINYRSDVYALYIIWTVLEKGGLCPSPKDRTVKIQSRNHCWSFGKREGSIEKSFLC